MISAAELGTQEIENVVNVQNAKKLIEYLKEEFGLTEDVDFEGIYPILALMFEHRDVIKGMYMFFHDLHVLEKQIQNYLELLGADIGKAEKIVGEGAEIGLKERTGQLNHNVHTNQPAPWWSWFEVNF